MSEHTTTPWRQVKHTIWSDEPNTQKGPTAITSGETVEEAEANAEFIVRACNSHDIFLNTLKNIRNSTKLMPNDYESAIKLVWMLQNAATKAIEEIKDTERTGD